MLFHNVFCLNSQFLFFSINLRNKNSASQPCKVKERTISVLLCCISVCLGSVCYGARPKCWQVLQAIKYSSLDPALDIPVAP